MSTDLQPSHNIAFSVVKLQCLGLIWCDGSHTSKAKAFYNILQPNGIKTVSHSDKEFEPNLYCIFDLACEITFRLAPKYTKVKYHVELTVDKSFYHELRDQFIDEVFENECKLSKNDWIEEVADKQNYIFYPIKIRKKMGLN